MKIYVSVAIYCLPPSARPTQTVNMGSIRNCTLPTDARDGDSQQWTMESGMGRAFLSIRYYL